MLTCNVKNCHYCLCRRMGMSPLSVSRIGQLCKNILQEGRPRNLFFFFIVPEVIFISHVSLANTSLVNFSLWVMTDFNCCLSIVLVTQSYILLLHWFPSFLKTLVTIPVLVSRPVQGRVVQTEISNSVS